tara:strand:+ start:960 stop:1259 length:300 start_codon:yes stop_codon:yes gene_type:complete
MFIDNDNKITFDIELDIAEQQMREDQDNSKKKFEETIRDLVYDITDYFDESDDTSLYPNVVEELVHQWFKVDPVKAQVWVQENHEQAKEFHLNQMRLDL